MSIDNSQWLPVDLETLCHDSIDIAEEVFLHCLVDLQHVAGMLCSSTDLLLQEVVDPLEVSLHLIVVVLLLCDRCKPLGFNSPVDLSLLVLELIHLLVIQLLMQSLQSLSQSLKVT